MYRKLHNFKCNEKEEYLRWKELRKGGGPKLLQAISMLQSRDRIPVEARFSAPVQTGPGAHPASCTMGTASFPGVKSGQGVMLIPHPLLVSWSMKG
jgi:hypothetical protein